MSVFLAVFVFVGTLGTVNINDETIRTINTFLNFLSIALLMYNQRRVRVEIEPKVNQVIENTKHLNEWDSDKNADRRDQ